MLSTSIASERSALANTRWSVLVLAPSRPSLTCVTTPEALDGTSLSARFRFIAGLLERVGDADAVAVGDVDGRAVGVGVELLPHAASSARAPASGAATSSLYFFINGSRLVSAIAWMHDEGIHLHLVADDRSRSVARVHHRFRGQCVQPVLDGEHQIRPGTTGKIGAADTSVEEGVAGHEVTPQQKAHRSARMSRGVNHRELELVPAQHIAVVQLLLAA